jgi:3-isopropylmalate dehydrogenase
VDPDGPVGRSGRLGGEGKDASMLKIAVIGGDGTGPEVVAEGLKVLAAVSKLEKFKYDTQAFDFSGKRYRQTGKLIDDADIQTLRGFDAIYLGAVGDPDVPPGVLERNLLLRLRFELRQFINLRPVKLLPGVWTPLKDKGPQDIDFVVIRENNEGLYGGNGGFTHHKTPDEVATQTLVATRAGIERCVRWAFDYCRRRNRKKLLTLVGKTNILTYAQDLWWRVFNEVGDADYPDIKRDYNHVDACCMWFVKNPEFYDVIVTDNMFGDIITDLGAMIQGGMGVAAGGNINPNGVSMFEPIGGSAPKYTGKGVINPIAAINAMAMLLETVGQTAAAARVEKAVAATTVKMKSQSAGKMGFSTGQVGDLVCEAL